MSGDRLDRRSFVAGIVGSAAAARLHGRIREDRARGRPRRQRPPRIRFAVAGIDHPHIHSQVATVARAGGELVSVHSDDAALLAGFTKRHPGARVARSESEILEDPSIQLVLSSIVPDRRAPLGIRVMQHGKDYMVDKPGITSLEQLAEVRRVQAETKRIYSIVYGGRFENRAVVRAGELVQSGAIGRVVQTIGLGPHRISPATRPAWFWDKARFGGILCDLGSHQADQFLFFTRSTEADVVASQVANANHPRYPAFEDFGDMLLRGNGGRGYARVDWFTPDGLATWGDDRLTILGTDGYIEVRENIDIAGRPGGSHLFLVDQKETRRIDCSLQPLPYGEQLVDDVLNRTETAMPQAHCLLAAELVIRAQEQAV